MSKIFFTADPHFGDSGILRVENRPFAGTEEMDEALIANWNRTVSADDTVIVAGDVSWHTKKETERIIRSLNGRKVLVKGNHDLNGIKSYLDAGFDEVYEYPIIVGEWWIVSHEPPYYYNDRSPYGYIYGHVHSTPLYPTYTERTACVCVERHGYAPVSMADIVSTCEKLASPDKP